MSRFTRTLAALAVISSGAAQAQNGIHFVPFSYEGYTQRGANCMALGYNRDVNEHSFITFEGQFGFRLFDTEALYSQDGYYNGYSVDYTMTQNWMGFQYRSCYSFRETDENSAYVGVTIGVRSAKTEISYINVYGLDYYDIPPAWAKETTERILMYPVGVRFGYRSPLDGYCGDIFIGVSRQFGKDLWTAPFIDDKDQLSGFSFQAGYAFGVGW